MQNNLKALATLTVGIIAVLVVVVAVFIPILNGLQDNVVSTENNTPTRYMVSENTYNLEITINEDGSFRVGNENYAATNYLAVIANDLFVNLSSEGVIQVNDSANAIISNVNGVEFDRGTYYYTANGTEYTGTYETLLYPSEHGTYGCMSTSSSFNVNNDDVVYIISRGANSESLRFVAELVNGEKTGYLVDPCTYTGNTYNAYTGTITINPTYAASEDALSIQYTGVSVNTETQSSFGVNIFAPVYYSVLDGNAEAVRSIMGVLPLVPILGLVIMAGYVMMSQIRGKSEL